MKKLMLFFIFIFLSNPLCAETSSSSFYQPQHGPLAAVNGDFHKQYENRVKQIIKTLGAPGGRPVILNLGGPLIFKYNGKTESVLATPASYHHIKVFPHAVFSVFLILTQSPEGSLSRPAVQALQELRSHLLKAEAAIPTLKLSAEAITNSKKIAAHTNHFLDTLLANKHWTYAELNSFYVEMSPFLAKSIKLASQIELDELDQTVNRWLAQMKPEEKEKLAVVVATVHQARAEETSVQYFEKKFGKHLGEGAKFENGLIVLEGKFDEASALSLLARHYLDRDASLVIFKEPERLQRDLLGDATKEILQRSA